MKSLVSALFFIQLSATAAHAELTISLDTGFARQVLEDVCSGNEIDKIQIRQSPKIKSMLSHFSQFRDYFTLDAYIEARQKAALCQKSERDIFRFNDVIDRKSSLLGEIEWLEANSGSYSQNITGLLAPYMPKSLDYFGTAIIAIGTPSCGGWSNASEFYVDLPCITDDPKGLQYLIAHESYHGIQDKFMMDTTDADPLVRLLDATVREGSATAFVDFSTISGGAYTTLNRETSEKNASRAIENFGLFDIAVSYLAEHPTEAAFTIVNNVGLSGTFDAPFYAVGSTMIKALEKAYGTAVLRCLLQRPPVTIFESYRELTVSDHALPKLGPATTAMIGKMIVPSPEQCGPYE